MDKSGLHYIYDAAGNIASKQVEDQANGATMTSYSHNSLNQITALGGSSGPKTVMVRGSTSEPASSVKVKSGAPGTWKDARMLEGNRFESDLDLVTGANQIHVQAKDLSNIPANYTYGLTLAAASSAAPTYDTDGNMTSDGVRSYEWDRMSRLVKITWGAGSNKTTEFRYNGLGQRSERIDKTGATETARYYYLYEGIKLLCRYTGGTAAANIDRQYLSQGEQRKNGAGWDSFYYGRDHLGSIREVVQSTGTLVARYDYDPYGKRTEQYVSGSYSGGCDLGYTGHVTQPSPVSGQTELVLTHFRSHDPELGRWLSADPIGEEGGLNLYGYVVGDPVNLYDLLGLRPPTDKFWPAYPNYDQSAESVWKGIGGSLNDTYGPGSNSCAARVSKGLNGSGEPIKPNAKFQTNKNSDGQRYIISAQQLRNYLKKEWGNPDKTINTPEELENFIKSLKPGESAVACSNRHAGVLKSGYTDPYHPLGETDVWILPATK